MLANILRSVFGSKKKKLSNTLFIHIGTGKTGTSAIQHYCLHHAKYHNFVYPKSCIKGYGHHSLAGSYTNEKEFKTQLGEMQRELSRLQFQNKDVFISSEEFVFMPKLYISMLAKSLNSLSFKIKIIYSYRNQIDSIKSHYFELIYQGKKFKDQGGKEHMMYIGNIDEFFNNHTDSFNNLKIISPWANVFGKENVITFLYDKAYFNSNFLNAFLRIIDPKIVIGPHKNKVIHHSLDSKFIEIIKKLDKLGINDETRKKIVVLLKEISKGDNKDILTPKFENIIKDTYKESNKTFLNNFVDDEKQYKIFETYNLSQTFE